MRKRQSCHVGFEDPELVEGSVGGLRLRFLASTARARGKPGHIKDAGYVNVVFMQGSFDGMVAEVGAPASWIHTVSTTARPSVPWEPASTLPERTHTTT